MRLFDWPISRHGIRPDQCSMVKDSNAIRGLIEHLRDGDHGSNRKSFATRQRRLYRYCVDKRKKTQLAALKTPSSVNIFFKHSRRAEG